MYLQGNIKCYMLLAGLIFAAPAWAEWVNYAETDNVVIYVDPDTIQTNGELRQLMQLSNNKEADPEQPNSSKMKLEYDCKDRRFRALSAITYADQMEKGEVVFEWPHPVAWKDVQPGPLETVLNTVCK